MDVIDAHCDLLGKLTEYPEVKFEGHSKKTDVSLARLQEGKVRLQFFALYLSEKLKQPSFAALLEMIDIGYRKVFSHPDMKLIRCIDDLNECMDGGRIGALLTLEGVEGLEGNLTCLRIAYYLGLRSVGITWNYANWAADGVGEPRRAGFSVRGKQLLNECAELGLMLDVSHLSEKGFWELSELYPRPFHASHSNVQSICPHPRNLNDGQLVEIITRKGMVGLTFVPYFVRPQHAQIKDLLLHIDHFCSMGGEGCIGFGSDFDGIEQWIPGLEHPGKYGSLTDVLLHHYPEQLVRGFMNGNWHRYLKQNLPRQ